MTTPTPEDRAEAIRWGSKPLPIETHIEIAAAIRAAVAEEREQLAVYVFDCYKGAALFNSTEAARGLGAVLNRMVGGERVCVEGQPMPTLETIVARIRELP